MAQTGAQGGIQDPHGIYKSPRVHKGGLGHALVGGEGGRRHKLEGGVSAFFPPLCKDEIFFYHNAF
jgi:hypothetical protein